MTFEFDRAVAHAADFWFKPCEDATVVTHARLINVKAEMRERHLPEADWEAGFFNYGTGAFNHAEGLFFITRSFAPTIEQRIASNFSIDSVPDPRHFICSWRDSGKDDAIGQTPKYTGLNDCTHFVTECLSKAKVPHILTNDPNEMFKRLHNMGRHTKTLAEMVPADKAKPIINSFRILQSGDVIVFATPQHKYLHCGLYLGNSQIAQHTHINHARAKSDQRTDQKTGKTSNWEVSANDVHPLVTVVHFTRDNDISVGSTIPGWWEVTRGATTKFYFFDQSGGVGTPLGTPDFSRPLVHPHEKGFWFQDSADLTICWTKTGDTELYWPIVSSRITGRVNGVDPVVAVKRS